MASTLEISDAIISFVLEGDETQFDHPDVVVWLCDVSDRWEVREFLLEDSPFGSIHNPPAVWTVEMLVTMMLRHNVFWAAYEAHYDFLERYILTHGDSGSARVKLERLGSLALAAVAVREVCYV